MTISMDPETLGFGTNVVAMEDNSDFSRLKMITSSDNLLNESDLIMKNNDKSSSDVKCNRNVNNGDYALQLETLQKTIDDLKEDNERFRLRKEGAEIVTKLLHEARQEMITVKKTKQSLEIAVHALQSRLEQNNVTSDISLQDDDIFIPGPSKKIMDDLVRENARLKTMVRNSNPDEVRQSIQQKQLLQDLEEHAKQSQLEIMQYREKVAQLQSILQSTDNEKDKEIILMKERVDKLNQEAHVHDIQRLTLTDENIALRQQLREMAARCQHIEKHKQPMKQELLTRLDMLQSENAALKLESEDVKQKNHRWNEYNSQREKYVQQLQKNITDLHDKQNQIDQLLVLSKEKLERSLQEKAKLDQELHNQVEINKLQAADCREYEKVRRQTMANRANPDPDILSVYKHQIQVFKQDFEQEREDREKAQQRVLDLEAKKSDLEQSLDRYRQMLSLQQNANVAPGQPIFGFGPPQQAEPGQLPRHMAPHHMYRPARPPPPPGASQIPMNIPPDAPGHLMARSAGSSSHRHTAPIQGADEPDYVIVNTSEQASDDIETDSAATSGEELRCPTCAASYTPNQAEEFKQHTDTCTTEDPD